MAEAGLPSHNFEGWLALVGPAGLPAPLVERLNADVNAALGLQEVRSALVAQAVTVTESSPASAVRFNQGEMDKHARLVRQSGAKIE